MQNNEEAILAFRKAFKALPDELKEREVTRALSIIKDKPLIVLEDHDIGKVIKFLDVPNLIEYLWREKHLRVDRSFLYKVLKGQYKLCYGYKVYYENIE